MLNTSTHLLPLATAAVGAGLRVQLLDVDAGPAFPILLVEVADGRLLTIDEENHDDGYTANLWTSRREFDRAFASGDWTPEPIYTTPSFDDPDVAVAEFLSAVGVTR